MKKKGQHEKILEELVKRLELSGRYQFIFPHWEYCVGRCRGELDCLTYHASSKTFHYYEVKRRFSEETLRKANKQYDRFKYCFPDYVVKGIYVSPELIKRLR